MDYCPPPAMFVTLTIIINTLETLTMRLLKILFISTTLLASISSAHANFTYDFTAAYKSGTHPSYVTGTPLTGYITLSSNALGNYENASFASEPPDFDLPDYVVAFSVTDGLNTYTNLNYFDSSIIISSRGFRGFLSSSDYSFYVGSNYGYFYSRAVSFDSATFTLRQATAAVPEPETYALFLAGLGLLGFAAKGKKRA